MPTLAAALSRKARHTPVDASAPEASPGAAGGRAAGWPSFLQRHPGVVQAKLHVDQPGDSFEQEAEGVAQRVTQGVTGAPAAKSPSAPIKPASPGPADAGSPLSGAIRARVEPVLGASLDAVRVHTTPPAREAASQLNARAFTHRNHIWLGPQESPEDTALLAHEATHVAQQADGSPCIQRLPDGSEPTDLAGSDSTTVPTVPPPASAATAGTPEVLPPPTGDPSAKPSPARGKGDAGPATDANPGDTTGTGPEQSPKTPPVAGRGGNGGGAEATGEPGAAATAGFAPDTGAGDLETGDLVLIDVELAEHQRWEGALGQVGEASSVHRAEFIAEAVGSGFISGAASGLATGLGIGLVTRVVPALGPIIGGGMALHGLVTRDWAETGATIGRFGEGSDTYETLANTIASVSAIIDIVSQVLTVINGIVGIVQIAALAIAGGAVVLAFVTFGATAGIAVAAGEVAATCEEIQLGITAVTSVLDEVNSAILQPCVTLFRALHAFTTQADPREVEAQGRGISTAAAASGAALGAWAGGKAAHVGGGGRPPAEEAPPSQKPPHETPPPAPGEGPVVHFQEPPAPAPAPEITAPATPAGEPVAAASTAPAPEPVSSGPTAGDTPAPKPAAAQNPASFAELNDVVHDLNQSPFGDRLASRAMAPAQDVPRDTTQSPQAVHDAAYADIRTQRPAGWDPEAGLQDQHWTKVKDATIKATGTDPASVEAINANRSPLATFKSSESTLLLTTQGVPEPALPTGNRGTRFFVAEPGEGPMGRPAVAAAPGIEPLPAEPGAVGGPQRDASYNSEHRFADRHLIPEQGRQIQASRAAAGLPPLDDVQLAVAAGEQARYIMEGVPRTDLAQNPVQPWSGEVIQRPRTPMQMLLAPEVLMPDLHQQGRTVSPPPQIEPPTAPAGVLPVDPNQISFDFGAPAPSSSPGPAAPEPIVAPESPAAPVETTPPGPPTPPGPAPESLPPPGPAPQPPLPPVPRGGGGGHTEAPSVTVENLPPGGPQPGAGPPTFATRAHQVGELFLPQFFGAGGKAPTYAEQEAAHRAKFTADNQPAEGVERVNPAYTPPPATPAQIVAIQDQIVNLLAVRAQAEQEAEHQSDRADCCAENQAPIRQTAQDTAAGISAVQAHDAAIARRDAVNQEQQQRQQESQGLVAGYPSRATGLTALSVPLAAWETFTSIASHLPGEAGDSMLRMNGEARKMQDAFGQMAAHMTGVDSAGPARQAELQGDQARLEATSEQAQASDEKLQTASEGAAGLQDANDAALAEAAAARDAATDHAQQCDDAAADREKEADSLAEQLKAWAAAHQAARQQAIMATEQRLEKEGRKVVPHSEP